MNLPEQEYHDYPAWSYSKISKYAKEGFSALKTIHDKTDPTPSMKFGSLFDTLITGDDFHNRYVVSDTVPPPAEKKVLDYLLSVTDVPFYDIPTYTMEEAISACQYQQKWKYPTQYEHIESERDYYEKRRGGKEIVSTADYDEAKAMAEELWSNSVSGNLFKRGDNGNVEYIYQAQFKVMYKDQFHDTVEIKIMPDLLVVDHDNKTIQPVDLKTSSMEGFDWWKENFVKYRYDIQAELYTDVMRVVTNQYAPEYKDYTILPYIFTDISRTDKVPVSYTYDPSEPLTIGEYQFKGWRQLLGEILSYEEEHAVVPSNIKTDELNDLRDLLNSPRR